MEIGGFWRWGQGSCWHQTRSVTQTNWDKIGLRLKLCHNNRFLTHNSLLLVAKNIAEQYSYGFYVLVVHTKARFHGATMTATAIDKRIRLHCSLWSIHMVRQLLHLWMGCKDIDESVNPRNSFGKVIVLTCVWTLSKLGRLITRCDTVYVSLGWGLMKILLTCDNVVAEDSTQYQICPHLCQVRSIFLANIIVVLIWRSLWPIGLDVAKS